MKRNDGAYVLVKRYKKETHNEHHKGNGTSDYYEPEFDSKNPTEFVQKVSKLRQNLPVLEKSPIKESNDSWKYEGIPLNFKEAEEKYSKLDIDGLLYVKKDLEAVIDAGNSFVKIGQPYPKLGYYTDELHVVNAEIRKRQAAQKAPLKEEGEGASPSPTISTADMPSFSAYGMGTLPLQKRRNP